MIEINNKKNCMGCGACKNICPQKCIEMKEDEEGFLYPMIDKDKCIDCHLCEKICPVLNVKNNEKESLEVYAAVNKNKDVLKNSSSGGVFYELALKIIEDGGIVFGAAFNEKLEVQHIGIEKKEDIKKLQGSKYVQSDINNQYEVAKKELKKGRNVLFSGAPCQIAGLKKYLKKDYDNLITCDFICTGIPSPKIFKIYRNQFIKNNYEIVDIKFRDKKNGWINFGMNFIYKNKNKYINRYKDCYINSFYMHYTLRPACYDCKFKYLNSQSDIKLADYWLVKQRYPDFYNYNGVSHVLINTKNGKIFFDTIKEKFKLKKSSYKDVLEDNLSFSKVVEEPKQREQLFNLIDKDKDKDTLKYLKKCVKKSLFQKFHDFTFIYGSNIKYKYFKK